MRSIKEIITTKKLVSNEWYFFKHIKNSWIIKFSHYTRENKEHFVPIISYSVSLNSIYNMNTELAICGGNKFKVRFANEEEISLVLSKL
jgi:hypothetical protein